MEEVWKDIIGYEEYYQVSNKGNVRSKDRWYDAPYLKNKQVIFRKGVSIKPRPNKYGYLTVCLKKNSKGKTIKNMIKNRRIPLGEKPIKGEGWILNPNLSTDKLTAKKRNVTALRTACN